MAYKKILFNDSKYLTPILVDKCFYKNQIIHVDKQVCGNGFSTSFLSITPATNKVNIIIAPNKAVIIEKESAYINGKIQGNNKIKFFHKDSTEIDFNNADVLFFVADSFLLRSEKIKEIRNRIDKVLIDEFHNVEIQSSFRYNLKDFESKVKGLCNDINTSIVTVTASPNLYSTIDILIKNKLINESVINVSKDRKSSLNRIISNLKDNKNVVLFTNSAAAIYNLRNYKNELEANYIIGENLTRSLTELFTIKQNTKSNLTIVSSKGFEGFDLYCKDANVYFLEDRANDFETFYISNLYQAINRTRLGAKYIEYNRLELSKIRKNDFKNIDIEVNEFINRSDISINEKQKKENIKYKNFVIFQQDSNGIFSLKRNNAAINLHKETLLYDKPFPAPGFKEFLEIRNIKINHFSEVNNRISKKVKSKIKVKNLLNNSKLIKEMDLFGVGYRLEVKDLYSTISGQRTKENRALYLKHLETYLRRKNYNNEYINSERENTALNLLTDVKKYDSLVANVIKEYKNRSIAKYGIKDSFKHIEDFKKNSYNIVCKFILMFANNSIGIPSNWVSNRNYNLLTTVGVNEIKLIAKEFNTTVTEIDIKSCFSRVLYGLNGFDLPNDFYGENKKNKLSINIFLNNFFYDNSKKSEKKLQRNNAILKFKSLGFNDNVIKYLINHFFESKFKGDLFNHLSFYEKQIISDVLEMSTGWLNDGCIRRHDSVIIFNNKTDLTVLNKFRFLDAGNWFEVKDVPVIKLVPNDDFNEFLKDLGRSNLSMNDIFKIKNEEFRLMAL